jgi:hypothetical protein
MHPGRKGGRSAPKRGETSFGRNRLSPNRGRLKPRSWRVKSRIGSRGAEKEDSYQGALSSVPQEHFVESAFSRCDGPQNPAAKAVRVSRLDGIAEAKLRYQSCFVHGVDAGLTSYCLCPAVRLDSHACALGRFHACPPPDLRWTRQTCRAGGRPSPARFSSAAADCRRAG